MDGAASPPRSRYDRLLAGLPITSPRERPGDHGVYHLFTIRTRERDGLLAHLSEQGIQTAVHYPMPLHRQPLYRGGDGGGFPESELASPQEDVARIVVYDDFSRGRLDNLEWARRDPRVSLFELGGNILQTDLLNAAMRDTDYVVHLAALWLLHCQDYPRSAFEVNIGGTFNVLEACMANGVKRLVYSSSAFVYGDAVEVPMTEDHPFNNRTFYGATKIAGGQMCRAFHHRHGLDYVALRYMNVYGPRQDDRGAYTSVVMQVLERIDHGDRPVIFGDGSSFDFIAVRDVARAVVLALTHGAPDHAYNVGTGVRTTVAELVRELLALTDSRLEPEFRHGPQRFVQHRVGSTEKATRELGFRAEVALRKGLQELIAWRRMATKP